MSRWLERIRALPQPGPGRNDPRLVATWDDVVDVAVLALLDPDEHPGLPPAVETVARHAVIRELQELMDDVAAFARRPFSCLQENAWTNSLPWKLRQRFLMTEEQTMKLAVVSCLKSLKGE